MTEPSARFRVGPTAIWSLDGAFLFAAGLQVDADGAPNCYHAPTAAHPLSGRPPGLDDLRNAGHAGDWWGIVTDDGKPTGRPIVQGSDDPYPGYYVSQTALQDRTQRVTSPRRYVDSSAVPYLSLPGRAFGDALALGDLAMVFYQPPGTMTVERSAAIYADVGPADKIGEGSIALAQALGLFRGVDVGHDRADVIYLLFPGSHACQRWPRKLDDMHAQASVLFEKWGGLDKLRAQFPHLLEVRS